jgi:hypothetical protein
MLEPCLVKWATSWHMFNERWGHWTPWWVLAPWWPHVGPILESSWTSPKSQFSKAIKNKGF